MGKSVLDANVNNSIFRKDWGNIIAIRRDLATIMPARLVLNSGGYPAGQVVARKTSDGLFYKWSAISGGTYDSVAILFEDVTSDDQPTTGGALARVMTAGYVFKDALAEYDSTAKTQLGAKEITDARGSTIVKF